MIVGYQVLPLPSCWGGCCQPRHWLWIIVMNKKANGMRGAYLNITMQRLCCMHDRQTFHHLSNNALQLLFLQRSPKHLHNLVGRTSFQQFHANLQPNQFKVANSKRNGIPNTIWWIKFLIWQYCNFFPYPQILAFDVAPIVFRKVGTFNVFEDCDFVQQLSCFFFVFFLYWNNFHGDVVSIGFSRRFEYFAMWPCKMEWDKEKALYCKGL